MNTIFKVLFLSLLVATGFVALHSAKEASAQGACRVVNVIFSSPTGVDSTVTAMRVGDTIRISVGTSGCNGTQVSLKVNRNNVQDLRTTLTPTQQEGFSQQNFTPSNPGTYQACAWVGAEVAGIPCSGTLTVSGTPTTPGTTTPGTTTPGTTTPGTTTPAQNPQGQNGNNAGGLGAQLYNPLKSDNLGQLMLTILRAFIILIAAWAVLFVIIGGFRMVMSQGKSEDLVKAKATITWAIAGVIVSLLAFSLVAIVQNLIGYKGL